MMMNGFSPSPRVLRLTLWSTLNELMRLLRLHPLALVTGCLVGLFGQSVSVLADPISFNESSAATGLNFQHVSPISPERHLHLFMGSGLAWSDFDRDGCLDLLFCQGSADPRVKPGLRPSVELWRGDLSSDRVQFRAVSQNAGFHGSGYAMGMTVADYDNDGFADLFVTGVLSASLYHNNGDGSFSDRTTEAGIVPDGFGSGCCWVDLDSDGNLDLVYVRYVKLDPQRYPLCTVPYQGKQIAISCNPKRLIGDRDTVYQSQGDGHFADVTVATGFSSVPARHGLGCVALDLDDDRLTEIYIANDGMPNDLWKNLGDLKFEERSFLAGVAVNRFGAAEAGMGTAAGDIDGDLKPELFVTNYFDETNTLYRNEGNLLFLDVTDDFGIAGPSRKRLGFGATFADFDNDGWLDLFVANGHVQDQLLLAGITDQSFAERSQVFANRQGRRFEDVSTNAGNFFQQDWVGRGSAAADYDGDGNLDLAVLRLNDRVALLRNTQGANANWLSVELNSRHSNRDAIGAAVIVRSESSAWRRDRMSSASYLSCDQACLHFGLGRHTTVESIEVRWPGGAVEKFPGTPTGRIVRLVEGTGSTSGRGGKTRE